MQGVSLFILQKHFKYKIMHLMQTDLKFWKFFLSFDMYLNKKQLNELGYFKYIYKSLNVFLFFFVFCFFFARQVNRKVIIRN